MQRPCDLGELDVDPIDPEEPPSEPWEKRLRVLVWLPGHTRPPVMTMDELRRGIEDLGAQDYTRLRYYDCWATAMANILLHKGVIAVEELGSKMDEVAPRWKKGREQ